MAAVSWSRLIQERFPSPFPPETFSCSKPGWYVKHEIVGSKMDIKERETKADEQVFSTAEVNSTPQDDDFAIARLLQEEEDSLVFRGGGLQLVGNVNWEKEAEVVRKQGWDAPVPLKPRRIRKRVRRKEVVPEELEPLVECVGGVMCVRDINVEKGILCALNVLSEQQAPQEDVNSSRASARLGADCISYYTIDCLNTCDDNTSLYPEIVIGGYRVADDCDEETRLLRIEAQTRLCRSEFGSGYCRENAIRKEPPPVETTQEPSKYLLECGYDVSFAIENEITRETAFSETLVEISHNDYNFDSLEMLPTKHSLFDGGFTPFNCVVHPLPEEEDEEQWEGVDFRGWRDELDEYSYHESLSLAESDEIEYGAWWAEARDGLGSLLIPGLWDQRNDYGKSARHLKRRCTDETKKVQRWTRLLQYWIEAKKHPSSSSNSRHYIRRRNHMVKAARMTVKMCYKLPQGKDRDHWRQPTAYSLELAETRPRPEQYITAPGSSLKQRKRLERSRKEDRAKRAQSLNYERHTRGSLNKRAVVSSLVLLSQLGEVSVDKKVKRNRLLLKPTPVITESLESGEGLESSSPRQLASNQDIMPLKKTSYREELMPIDFVEDEHSYLSRLHLYRQYLDETDNADSFEWLLFDSFEESRDEMHKPNPKMSTRLLTEERDFKLTHLLNSILQAAVLSAGKQSMTPEDKPQFARRLALKTAHLDFPVYFTPKPKFVFRPPNIPGTVKKDKVTSKKNLQADAGFTKGGTDVIDLSFDFLDSADSFSSKAEKLKIGMVRMLQRYVDYDPAHLPDEIWLLQQEKAEWINEGEGEEDQRRNRCWDYVSEPVPRLPEDRELTPGDGRDAGHAGWTPRDFAALPEAEAAQLSLPELMALRLYTGPAYTMLQQSCRRDSLQFQITLFCLECAIVKLGSKNREQFNVFRGVKGQMPAEFQGAYFDDRASAIADKAFISATRDLDIALGPKYGGNIVYAFRCSAPQHAEITFDGWLKGGADVAWVSQFPDEQEVLFPRFTELLPFPKAKRWVGWSDEMKKLTSQVEAIYEFEPTYHYNEKHTCPNVPGLRS